MADITLSSIEITQNPIKIRYFVNETFSSSGLIVTARYSDGSSRTLSNTEYSLSDPVMSTAGSKTVTVTYQGKTVNFNIEVIRKLTSISVTNPTKTKYFVNETFSSTGLQITAYYNNSTNSVITGYTLNPNPPNMATVGSKTITVTYIEEGITVTTSFSIEVIRKLLSISVVNPKTTYFLYDIFDPTGLEITANYNNSTNSIITSYTLNPNPPDMNTVGTKSITVSYTENEIIATISFTIEVNRKLLSIEITKNPKMTYFVNEIFDISGLEITAFYNNGTSTIVNYDSISNPDMTSIGVKIIEINYQDKTAILTINVYTESNFFETDKTEYFQHIRFSMLNWDFTLNFKWIERLTRIEFGYNPLAFTNIEVKDTPKIEDIKSTETSKISRYSFSFPHYSYPVVQNNNQGKPTKNKLDVNLYMNNFLLFNPNSPKTYYSLSGNPKKIRFLNPIFDEVKNELISTESIIDNPIYYDNFKFNIPKKDMYINLDFSYAAGAPIWQSFGEPYQAESDINITLLANNVYEIYICGAKGGSGGSSHNGSNGSSGIFGAGGAFSIRPTVDISNIRFGVGVQGRNGTSGTGNNGGGGGAGGGTTFIRFPSNVALYNLNNDQSVLNNCRGIICAGGNGGGGGRYSDVFNTRNGGGGGTGGKVTGGNSAPDNGNGSGGRGGTGGAGWGTTAGSGGPTVPNGYNLGLTSVNGGVGNSFWKLSNQISPWNNTPMSLCPGIPGLNQNITTGFIFIKLKD